MQQNALSSASIGIRVGKRVGELQVENRIESKESFIARKKKILLRPKIVEIAKKCAWSEVYRNLILTICTIECGVFECIVRLGHIIGRGYWSARATYFNINDNIFAQQLISFYPHSRWICRLWLIQFSWFFMFGSRWMRGVINLFFCRLFACVSIFLFILFTREWHRGWRSGWHFFCDYDDEESLIIVTAVIFISRQHLTCFMAQQFTRTLHIVRVRSFVIDLCSKRSSIPI